MKPYLSAPFQKYVTKFIIGLLIGAIAIAGTLFAHIRTAQGTLRARASHVVAEPGVQPLFEREGGLCHRFKKREVLGRPSAGAKPERPSDRFLASVTMYSATESCSYPKDGGCLTASGRIAQEGVSAACPRSVPLGKYIVIGGKRYRCDDRTAEWVQRKHGPTFDIFGKTHAEAIRFGRKRLEVTILSK